MKQWVRQVITRIVLADLERAWSAPETDCSPKGVAADADIPASAARQGKGDA